MIGSRVLNALLIGLERHHISIILKTHLRELSIEGVPNIYDICEPKSGIFPLQLAVELNKLNVIDKLFELGCHPNTCDLEGNSKDFRFSPLTLDIWISIKSLMDVV